MPDTPDTRLVVLPAEHPYSKGAESLAEKAAQAILEMRGNAPRRYRNTLVFLAADSVRMQDLDDALRRYLAWTSICKEKEALNLDPHQARQAETQKQAADGAVTARLPEVYQWLLVPEQRTPQTPPTWEAIRLAGRDALAGRAAKRLRGDELLLTSLGPTILRKHLDDVPLWRGHHVKVKQLLDDFALYLYLPRLAGPEVLLRAMEEGFGLLMWETESFAYADGYDDAADRYTGLRTGRTTVTAESAGLLVKPDVAARQLDKEAPPPDPAPSPTPDLGPTPAPSSPSPAPPEPAPVARRYHGTAVLDPTRVGRDASRIADEVIAHLAGIIGADVRVTLEIEAKVAAGVPDRVVRIVTENGHTLGFPNQGFEHE